MFCLSCLWSLPWSGFFASLKFYRDGVELQKAANDALTKLEEKTQFIQTQVGGMFDKTLDAAIGKKEILFDQFEELNEQLEKTKTKLIEESIGQIGAAGEQEQKRLSKLVDHQISLIRAKVETTRESAEEMVQPNRLSLTVGARTVLDIVAASPDGLTLRAIAEKMQMSQSGVSRRLRELMQVGLVEEQQDKYFARQIRLAP